MVEVEEAAEEDQQEDGPRGDRRTVRPGQEVEVGTVAYQLTDGRAAALHLAEMVECLVEDSLLHAVACQFHGSYLGDFALNSQ